jgi:hypothetical protein
MLRVARSSAFQQRLQVAVVLTSMAAAKMAVVAAGKLHRQTAFQIPARQLDRITGSRAVK